jgi:hypothetical protein
MLLATIKKSRGALVRLYQCDRGAEGLEKLLIVGAIVLPLLGVLVFFRNELKDWVTQIWEERKDQADDFDAGGGL